MMIGAEGTGHTRESSSAKEGLATAPTVATPVLQALTLPQIRPHGAISVGEQAPRLDGFAVIVDDKSDELDGVGLGLAICRLIPLDLDPQSLVGTIAADRGSLYTLSKIGSGDHFCRRMQEIISQVRAVLPSIHPSFHRLLPDSRTAVDRRWLKARPNSCIFTFVVKRGPKGVDGVIYSCSWVPAMSA